MSDPQPPRTGPAGSSARPVPQSALPQPPAKTEKPQEKENVKETIESILVAFILAFIFRAFVVEAFVIPTGSMGPTLMGAHVRVECPDCGYHFTSNYSKPRVAGDPRRRDDTDIPAYVNFEPGK